MFRPNAKYAPTKAIAEEDVDLLDVIRRQLPNKPALQTMVNWCLIGIKNKFTGERILLEWIFMPMGRATSIKAVKRFYCRISEMPKQLAPKPRRPKSVSPRRPKAKKRRCRKKA